MKTNKSFRLSVEAVKILDEQDNATEFLEGLIIGHKTLEVVSVDVVKELLKALITPLYEKNTSFAPQSNQGEPMVPVCCMDDTKPCRHWAWDSDKLGYLNSITGELREVL